MWSTLTAYIQQIKNNETTVEAVHTAYTKKILWDTTNAFLNRQEYIDRLDNRDTVKSDNAGNNDNAWKSDNAWDSKNTWNAANQSLEETILAWAPIAVKDIFMVEGYTTTSWSKMLEDYKPPYSATAIHKLEAAWWVIIGKTNMDEFAMGSGWETSAFWPTHNPYDHTRVSGGSSSGSAAAVAWDLCVGALWTDTWGSVRLPAALCGIVWVKPTYGRISRYGVQAMASSFDHVGVFSKTVRDGALLTQVLAGKDTYDATTQKQSDDTSWWLDYKTEDWLKGMRFALPKQFLWDGIDEDCRQNCLDTIAHVESLWWVVDQIDFSAIDYAVSIYYILVPAEVSTNLQRYDWIRYWLQKDTAAFDSIFDYYAAIRNEGFWEEVKRRILTGSYVLSAGHQDAYYNKALQARKAIQDKAASIFEQYDGIVWPMTTQPAWKIWEYSDDPVSMYLMDKFGVLANMIHAPALSVPSWYVQRDWVDLPVWFQIITKPRDEKTLFKVWACLEEAIDFTPTIPTNG